MKRINIIYMLIFFSWFSDKNHAENNHKFNYSIREIENAYLTGSQLHKQVIAHSFLEDNLELRPKDAVYTLLLGLKNQDPVAKEYSIASVYKILGLKNVSDKYPIFIELINNYECKQQLILLTEDANSKTRMAALSTLEIGYGPSEAIKDIILSRIDLEEDEINKRNAVKLLSRYVDDKNVQSVLLSILAREKTESAEIASVILANYKLPIYEAIPSIVDLLESEERYADDDLLGALASYGYLASPYLDRIDALRDGIKLRSQKYDAPLNFKRHAAYLISRVDLTHNNIIQSESKNIDKYLQNYFPDLSRKSFRFYVMSKINLNILFGSVNYAYVLIFFFALDFFLIRFFRLRS